MRIIVNMACGLANRMFQYTYFLFLTKKGYNAKIDFYETAVLAHEKVEWERIFPEAYIKQACKWDIFRLGGGVVYFLR